jgi:hypothetical protein
MGDLVGAAIGVAGSIAAFVASGVITGLAGKLAAETEAAETEAASVDGQLATGTEYASGGDYLVGEQGPEIVKIPQGASVDNASKTASTLNNNSKSVSFTFNSPKALNQVESLRAARKTARELAFTGVL